MFCTNCGARVDADARFCQRCGNAIKRDEEYETGRSRGSSSGTFGNARRKVEDYVRDPQRTQELLAMALGKANARRSTPGVIDDI